MLSPKGKAIITTLSIFLIVGGLQYYFFKDDNSFDKAVQKVSDLFVEHEDVLQERDALTLKDSTDQEQVNKAMKAVNKIDMFSEENDEHYSLVAFLHIALTDAQNQLNKRERKQDIPDTKEKEAQPKEAYVPNENDVILKNNELKNKELLEVFMQDAGEKGENGKSAIRVVKDEGEKGILVYDLESNYDKTAGQSWILVYTDVSYYSPSENEVQDVFTNGSQQCSYMSKDEIEGYYKLHECRTHWEYRLLPVVNKSQE